jgi:hypothetical protein
MAALAPAMTITDTTIRHHCSADSEIDSETGETDRRLTLTLPASAAVEEEAKCNMFADTKYNPFIIKPMSYSRG